MIKKFLYNLLKIWAFTISFLSIPCMYEWGIAPLLAIIFTCIIVAFMMTIGED